MSILGLDSGYTVKYTPPPSGVPSGFALGNFFDRISLLSFLYGYIIGTPVHTMHADHVNQMSIEESKMS